MWHPRGYCVIQSLTLLPFNSQMISIEHHPFHVPGMPQKHEEPVHYAAARNNDTGSYTINTHSIESEPGIVGNIAIAESSNATAEQVHKILEEELASGAHAKPSDEPEHWVRRAIHALQQKKTVEQFDVDEFITL